MEKFLNNFLFILILFLPYSVKASDLNIIGMGLYDFNKQKDEAADFRLEKRYDKTFFDLGPKEEPLYSFKPFYGIEITSDSAFYVLGGLFIEEKISKNFYITPSFGAGVYSKGNGKDLGNEIEFRSGLEISYELQTKKRIGLSVSHISNSSIGDKNPGTEILSLSYQFPF